MAISYTNTEDSVKYWTKHFMLMSDDNITPLVPGFYRVHEPKEESQTIVDKKIHHHCSSGAGEEEKVPISISTPSEQIVEVVQSDCVDTKEKHIQEVKSEEVSRKRKSVAVEPAGGNKRHKNSVKYCKDPRKDIKKFVVW